MTCVMASSAVATASSSELLRAVMYSSALVCRAGLDMYQQRHAEGQSPGLQAEDDFARSGMQNSNLQEGQVVADMRMLPAEGCRAQTCSFDLHRFSQPQLVCR